VAAVGDVVVAIVVFAVAVEAGPCRLRCDHGVPQAIIVAIFFVCKEQERQNAAVLAAPVLSAEERVGVLPGASS